MSALGIDLSFFSHTHTHTQVQLCHSFFAPSAPPFLLASHFTSILPPSFPHSRSSNLAPCLLPLSTTASSSPCLFFLADHEKLLSVCNSPSPLPPSLSLSQSIHPHHPLNHHRFAPLPSSSPPSLPLPPQVFWVLISFGSGQEIITVRPSSSSQSPCSPVTVVSF